MTQHESPYQPPATRARPGEKPSTLGKYGPSAVRDVNFVDRGGAGRPLVSVKQRKNGQYVVVEKLPAKNFAQTGRVTTVEQSLSDDVTLRSVKPQWKNTSKNHITTSVPRTVANPYAEKNFSPYKYAKCLPPIDLGYQQKAEAQVGSLDNVQHVPGGGDKLIFSEKPRWKAKARVGSLENLDFNQQRFSSSQSDGSLERKMFASKAAGVYGATAGMKHYTPGGGEAARKNQRYKDVGSKVGSLDNAGHTPGGGDVTIVRRRLNWHTEAKVGSLDNRSHRPQGGDIYIVNNKLSWQGKPRVGSLENVAHKPQVTVGKVPNYRTEWRGQAVVGSLDNIGHTPRGGNVVIHSQKLKWRAEAKVNSRPSVEEYLAQEDICESWEESGRYMSVKVEEIWEYMSTL